MTTRYSLRQRESGGWQARWYNDAGDRQSRMFPNRTEAKKFLDRVSADRQRGDYLDHRDAARTFASLAEEWLAVKVKRPKTLAGYETLLRVHLLPTFGPRPVGSLRPLDVRRWLADEQRRGVGPGTVRNAYRVLRPVLATAVENGCARTNPCDAITRDDMPASAAPEMQFLTADEVARLVAATREPYGALVAFAAHTGMRAREIDALQMAQVDLLRGRVRVEASFSEVGGQHIRQATKNGEARDVVLPPSLVRELRTYLATGPARGPADYLFSGVGGPGQPILHSWFYGRVFKPAVRAAGLPAGLRFHDLRHTCASLLIAENVPPKAIQAHLGHASFAITMDRYGHLYPAAADATRDALERAFSPTAKGDWPLAAPT